MSRIFVINGRPRAGKDTLIHFMQSHLSAAGVPHQAFSSIDPVRDMLTGAGFCLDAKTEADRKLLAVVGSAVEEHSNWRTQRSIDRALDFLFHCGGDGVFFLHMREPANIAKVQKWVADEGLSLGISMTTVLLRSIREEAVESNDADASVEQMTYDYTIRNDGSLHDLSVTAKAFLTGCGVLN